MNGKMKKVTAVILTVIILLIGGCTDMNSQSTSSEENRNAILDYGIDLYCPPEVGEQIVVMKTSMGTIYIRLFDDIAPKAVDNFRQLVSKGYYDGIIFHRVMNEFMIQGGDPTGTGYGGESVWGGSFADEFSPEAHNLRGALSMANSGANTNGSQFFIVQATSVDASLISQMRAASDSYPEKFVNAYAENGGTPWLDYKHTVFGFVFCGMEVVDAIASVAVNSAYKPNESVSIISATLEEYKGNL